MGEYAMFTVLREFSQNKDEAYLSDCSRIMIGHLRSNSLLQPGWSTTKGGRLQVRNSLLGQIAAGDERLAALELENSTAKFLDLAVTELVGTDAI
jgi:type I restriction enzyme R subunit